jgi:hypothetical protein
LRSTSFGRVEWATMNDVRLSCHARIFERKRARLCVSFDLRRRPMPCRTSPDSMPIACSQRSMLSSSQMLALLRRFLSRHAKKCTVSSSLLLFPRPLMSRVELMLLLVVLRCMRDNMQSRIRPSLPQSFHLSFRVSPLTQMLRISLILYSSPCACKTLYHRLFRAGVLWILARIGLE